ncbi:EamA family transporter [Micromonospora sp. NPDC047465]|uniref:EamA family transporter n=1 Tax=Micromonospora sp. NPDC047465 TaxID=3154813 RepID=UPI0033DAB881
MGLLYVTAAAVLWGTTGVAVQLVRESTALTPTGIGFYRLAIAAVVLLALVAHRPRPVLAALRSQPVVLVLVGVGLGGYQALYFLAVASGGVGVATVVSLGLAPVLVFGWESLRARRLPGRTMLGALVPWCPGALVPWWPASPASCSSRSRPGSRPRRVRCSACSRPSARASATPPAPY